MNEIKDLIQRIKPINPVLYDALNKLAIRVNALDKSIDEVRSQISAVPVTGLAIAADVIVFNYSITKRNVKLTWASPDPSIVSYEIRKGIDWNTAEIVLNTTTTSAVFDPLEAGSHTYQIKGIDEFGNYSVNPAILSFLISPPGVVSVTVQTFGSNVLLFWTIPTSDFEIAYYVIEKNSIEIGHFTGTFANLLELAGGTFSYTIYAVDIADNVGSSNTVTVTVADPSDFELQDELVSTLSGTKVNAIVSDGKLYAPVNDIETWEDHFVDNSWSDIEDQINAGYPLYIQPTPTTASYEETFDFGTIYNNTVVSISYLSNVLFGGVTLSIELEFSDDNVTYTPPVTGLVNFVESVRYVRVTVNFTGDDDTSLMEFYEFHVTLNVHREIDSGYDVAVSSDTDGTEFVFNKAFKDVDSITLTTDTTEPVIAIYEFDDIPDPTSFFVKAFDSAGKRITYPISWKARGII